MPSLQFRVIVAGQTLQGSAPQNIANIAAALKSIGLEINPLDRLTPSGDGPLRDGMTVRIIRVRNEIVKREVPVWPEKRYKPTARLDAGSDQTISGKPGVAEVTERVWTVDGAVTQREEIERQIVQAPVDTVVELGAKSRFLPSDVPYNDRYARGYALGSRGGSPRDRLVPPAPGTFRAIKCIELIATGYSPDPRENGGSTRTCSGLQIGYGAAAVDPRVIPLGTKLYVEGYGYAFACDTGGAIKGNRIDLAFDSYHVANEQGRKHVKVWILGK
ncbi:MAG TPA: 3D domain-containing protein [Verrucomicrobiae bacterium]|nr:3D domain-containing protein [Verrucomicrobiae bacterium]